MRKNKLNRLPIVLGILVLILCLILWALLPGSGLNKVVGGFMGAYRPLAESATAAGEETQGFFYGLFNSKALRNENRRLTEENANLQKEVQQLRTENEKYQELKSAFAIKDRFAGYAVRHAAVISRSFGNLFDMFSINMGTDDGLEGEGTASYPVVDADMNLVGRVDHISAGSAKVLPLISDGFTVMARVNQAGGATMRVHGDLVQAELGLCLLDGIKKDAAVKAGDELVTDGSGGLFPPGLKVGKIVDVTSQGDELVAVLKPFAEVRNLVDVFVLVPTAAPTGPAAGPVPGPLETEEHLNETGQPAEQATQTPAASSQPSGPVPQPAEANTTETGGVTAASGIEASPAAPAQTGGFGERGTGAAILLFVPRSASKADIPTGVF